MITSKSGETTERFLIFGDAKTYKRYKLPQNSRLGRATVILNNKQYQIDSASYGPDPCTQTKDAFNCIYEDQKFDGFLNLRIWKNDNGIIAINPMWGSQLDSIVITKIDPAKDTIFSQEEIEIWKDSLIEK
ncbi:MAG TPA: hypothetical protein VMW29_04170 [Candidatus Bathyarchaeia archaeon]|nr:hypothetical protein [Candidatus Bathyarchaeia archaeon]